MGIEEFTAPLTDSFQKSLGPLKGLISGHRSNHDDLRNLINSLVSTAGEGSGDLFAGLTALAVKDSTEHLIQMSEQRMQALEKMLAGFTNAGSSATNAVSKVVSAFLPSDLLDKVLQNMDIVGVIMQGENIVAAAINALLQTFLKELDDPFSLIADIAKGAIEVLTGVMPATLVPWGAEIFQLAQEVIQVINMVQSLLDALKGMATPIQELFKDIGNVTSPTFEKDLSALLKAIVAIELGVISAKPNKLSTVGQAAGSQAVNTLAQGWGGAPPNKIGIQPGALPGLGGTLDQYAEIIVNTPQGKQEILVPIHAGAVSVTLGGGPQGTGQSLGGIPGQQVTITITTTPPTAGANPMSGGVGANGAMLGAGQIQPGQMMNQGGGSVGQIGAPIMNQSGGSMGQIGAPTMSMHHGFTQPGLGYGGNIHSIGQQMVGGGGGGYSGGGGGYSGGGSFGGGQGGSGGGIPGNLGGAAISNTSGPALGGTASILGSAAKVMHTGGVHTDGSGSMWGGMGMGMGGMGMMSYGGGTTTTADDDK